MLDGRLKPVVVNLLAIRVGLKTASVLSSPAVRDESRPYDGRFA